ncbi:choline-sulfatase [Pseudovirgaria hyperparasitica]|uniref:Choline-sulfatase n=1 Tax=Pseudovirgaria hyperparasitica TaxID=470096 RepID=A0A6A6W6Q5_9PEZI|nr:choline-sulfatase [Pseudovirgaria hyperparasitica]KAF2757714.1 choline-sulfatase [Pseudovirgaria hyperparasitica]
MAPHAELPDTPPNGQTGYLPREHTEAVKPNILFIMGDQMSAPMLKIHDPSSVIQTPNIDRLAETGVVFNNAYCNSPLCGPSRFSLVSGQLPSKIGAYDNASHLGSDIPTFAHFLREEGYETVLAGKMHFIGADQLHGYESRLTPDIYPGDFGWAVNWDKPKERQEWYHNMSSVFQAGPCVRSNQLDFDEEVMYKSSQWLYNHVRDGDDKRPFFLTVSLTHPHDPYATTDDLYNQYEGVDIPLPKVDIPQSEQDPHSKRILECIDAWGKDVDPEIIKRARRAYFGSCTYVDNQVGKLVKILKDCRLDQNTIIVFSGDHGDMLGERGLWYKMSWFENSARVPLIVNYPPLFSPRRVNESVSTLDLPLTFLDMVGGKLSEVHNVDGQSFYPALLGQPVRDEVIGEYMGEGTISPVMMIRRGPWKYVICEDDPEQLYNLKEDPLELKNLVEDADFKEIAAEFAREAKDRWNLQQIKQQALTSQRQRRLCFKALKKGTFESWDYVPKENVTGKYIRSFLPLDDLELRARYPPVDELGRVKLTTHPHGLAAAKGQ